MAIFLLRWVDRLEGGPSPSWTALPAWPSGKPFVTALID
jgi:hypothetical protein